MKNKILIVTEGLACMVLVMVILGVASVMQTPAFSLSTPVSIGIVVWLMTALLVVATIFSIYRMSGRSISSNALVIFGILLMGAGSVMVYLLPSYFYIMLGLSLSFWHTVCIFSLPAICIEAGLFTLFTELQNKKALTLREQQFLTVAFLLYFSLAITINFVVLNGLWPVHHQILFYRMLTFFTVLLFIAVSYRKVKMN